MLKKIILFIIFFNFISQCGFTPLYLERTNVNFSIASINYEGDREINNFFKNQLYIYQNTDYEKKYKINIKSSYKKKAILKDKTAKIANYELSSVSLIEIILNDKLIKELKFSQKKIIDNLDDDFEEQKNERITKNNFVSSMANKLLTELSLINDN